jgi:hypothetical protein
MTSEEFRKYLKGLTWFFSIFLIILATTVFFSLVDSITAGKIITIVIILAIYILFTAIRRFYYKCIAEITFDEKHVYFVTYSKSKIMYDKNSVTEIIESMSSYKFILADKRRLIAVKYIDPFSAISHQNKFDDIITIVNFPNALIR